MSDSDLFIVYLIGFFIGLLLIVTGFWRYLVVQKLKNTPLSKVVSASVGLVALAGKARLYQPQLSPVSGVPCAYWRIFVSYHKSGKDGDWEGFYNAASKLPLSLEDETGRIPVLPEGATIEIPSNLSFEGYIRERGLVIKEPATMDPRVLKFIESLDAGTQELFAQHHERNIMLNEYVIHENDPLFVLGSALPAVDVPGLEDETLVVRQGPNDSTMYISESSEAAFMNTMSGHMYLQIIAGLALSAICLYLFLSIGGN
ncbi:MAG: hypothetical protein Q7T80_03095 [Methanoregula sp.]|nr:hypothetical protein [Methanoregula sp.]